MAINTFKRMPSLCSSKQEICMRDDRFTFLEKIGSLPFFIETLIFNADIFTLNQKLYKRSKFLALKLFELLTVSPRPLASERSALAVSYCIAAHS